MKRLVHWADAHSIEHAPLMMKFLVQAVCGGRRWDEAKQLGEHIAARAVADGMVEVGNRSRHALGLSSASQASPKMHLRKCATPARKRLTAKQMKTMGEDAMAAASSNAIAVQQQPTALAMPERPKRIVVYDVLDCTLGGGLHTGAVLFNGKPYTRVVALDCDYAVLPIAKELEQEFGPHRFRYYGNKMSEAQSMFGEDSFDAVMIDPGPTDTQLEDPRRGFQLDSEHDGPLDMRYGPQMRQGALDYLNCCSQSELSDALSRYGLLTVEQSAKVARSIGARRPFRSSRDVIAAVSFAGEGIPDEGWRCQASRRKLPMSMKFFFSVRGIVNSEYHELREGLAAALLVLRDGGRLTVTTRLQWEECVVADFVKNHPFALLLYCEEVPMDEVTESGHIRHTKLWAIGKTKKSAFVTKNINITSEEVEQSASEWVLGAVGGQRKGFPAQNFAFKGLDRAEKRAKKNMSKGVPFDHDTDHFEFKKPNFRH